jgi:hypothetical protein
MHLHTIKNPQDLLPAKYFFYSRFKFPLLIPAREISRSVALYKLIRTLLEDKPDLIYLRWGMYAFPLQLLSQNIPVIIEINTNDLHQHQLLGHILSTYNKYTRSTTLSMAKGLVFTTNELAKDSDFLSFSSKRIVIRMDLIWMVSVLPAPKPNFRIWHSLVSWLPGKDGKVD